MPDGNTTNADLASGFQRVLRCLTSQDAIVRETREGGYGVLLCAIGFGLLAARLMHEVVCGIYEGVRDGLQEGWEDGLRDAQRGRADDLTPERHFPPPLEVPVELPSEIPQEFTCPISFGLMQLPTMTPMGTTYDWEPLVRWVYQHHRYPAGESNARLEVEDLAPNLSLRNVIERWLRDPHLSSGSELASH